MLPLFVGVAALGITAHAVGALVTGLRARDAPSISRPARRCAWSVAAFVLFSGVMVAVSAITDDEHRGDAPEDRAARLALLVSEVMNTTAFVVVVSLLPLLVAAVLHLRARRASKKST